MTTDIHPKAKRRLNSLADSVASEFDATLLHNRVYEQIKDQHTTDGDLAATIDLTERTYQLDERVPGDGISDVFGAAEALNDTVDDRVAEQVAQACAVIICEAGRWTDSWEAAEIHAAQAEAREWVSENLDAVERAGVLERVKDAEVAEA
jgi:hypothetical protein